MPLAIPKCLNTFAENFFLAVPPRNILIHQDTYGYIYVHMDTHGYIEWIHMGAQEPGCGTKLAAGPWAHGQGQGQGPWTGPGPKGPWTGPGPMGPWPPPPHPRAPPPVLCHSLALGPPYVSILCIHVCPYVHRCIHMYPFHLFDSIHVQIEDCELLLGK